VKKVLWQELDEVEFAMKNIVTVAERRRDSGTLAECDDALSTLRYILFHREGEDRSEMRTYILEESLRPAYHIADNLAMMTMVEIREVLFPIQSIKQQAREFGQKFFDNYFTWLDYPDQYTPEQMMGLLEDDLRKLDQAKKTLANVSFSLHSKRAE
jgi:hypothetical protein